MKRALYSSLLEWKQSQRRKPLVLDGARQVGKTYALKYFGNTFYEKTAYINFEKNGHLHSLFDTSLDPKQLISALSIYTGITIEPDNTLIILDEIQECPKALLSLKYFCEEANDYHIAAAGSLLGIKTKGEKAFPVGKVNFLHLFPLSFFEFLEALNQKSLVQLLKTPSFTPLPVPFHEKLLHFFKIYLFTGGMPEVVASYIQTDCFTTVREVQQEILHAYEKDFAKHAPSNAVMKIITTWQQVPLQLAKENKKFTFSSIKKSARARDYEEAIQWLLDAGLIYKSFLIESPKIPLLACAKQHAFKLFLLDVGLLGAQSGLSSKALIEQDRLFTEFKGALIENYVAQELIATQKQKPYYWTSHGTAEVDFLIEGEEGILPLEVKAGANHKKKSLLVYDQKYNPHKLLRTTSMNLKRDGKVCNYPLYMISLLNILR